MSRELEKSAFIRETLTFPVSFQHCIRLGSCPLSKELFDYHPNLISMSNSLAISLLSRRPASSLSGRFHDTHTCHLNIR